MPAKFPPGRESLLVPWSQTFGDILTAEPVIHGVTPAQCTALMAKRTAFVDLWDLCQAPATKSKGNVSLKNEAKRALIQEIRLLARIVNACPTVTNPMRVALGLPERGLGPVPVPVPSKIPHIEVKKVYGPNVTLWITDPDDARRALPEGCQGIQLYSAIGEEAPPPGLGWKNEGVVTRREIIVAFPAATPGGSRVFFSAAYFNPRGMTGFSSVPVSTHTGFESGATATGDAASDDEAAA